MRAAPRWFAAMVVFVTGSGCAATQVRPHHLDDPAALVGKTIELRTPDGRRERIVVTRADGTTVTGHRPWDSASAVRAPEEITLDLRAIAGLEGSRVPTEAGPGAVEAGAEPVRDARWMYGALPGDTVTIHTTRGRTEVILVTAVGPTSLTGRPTRDAAAAEERSAEVTFQSAEIERIEIDRSGVRRTYVAPRTPALRIVSQALQQAGYFFGCVFIVAVFLGVVL